MKLIPDLSMIDSEKSCYLYSQPLAKSSLQPQVQLASKVDVKRKALMFKEYASHQATLFMKHEITNSAFFLMDEDGYLRKSVKSQLGTELLKLCSLFK